MAEIMTSDGAVGRDFIPAPAGLVVAIRKYGSTISPNKLGDLIGYARFSDGGLSEAVYADSGGLSRAFVAMTRDDDFGEDDRIVILGQVQVVQKFG